jgi:hypothetical protein
VATRRFRVATNTITPIRAAPEIIAVLLLEELFAVLLLEELFAVLLLEELALADCAVNEVVQTKA